MTDYLVGFTPQELELIKSQNGKFYTQQGVLHFEVEIPDELSYKISSTFASFYSDRVRDGETRRDAMTNPETTFQDFLFLLGLTDSVPVEYGTPREKGYLVLLDENTALSIISEDRFRKDIKGLALPGQLSWSFDKNGTGRVVAPRESYIQKVLNSKTDTQGYNVVLLQAIGTCIEVLYKHDLAEYFNTEDDTVRIPRLRLQKFLNCKIRKPNKEVLDFLVKNKAPQTEREWSLYNRIVKDYSFWVDLIALTRVGVMETKTGAYTVFNFKGYNEKEDLIECSSDYLFHAYQDLYNDRIIGPMRNNKNSYEIIKTAPPVVRGSLYTLKNKHSVEIIEELLCRLATRGVVPDAQLKKHYKFSDNSKVTVKITYKELLKSCPSLQHSFTSPVKKKDGTTTAPNSQYKRMVLRRAIFGENKTKKQKDEKTGKYNIDTDTKTLSTQQRTKSSLIEAELRRHTTVYSYYSDFKIKADPISLKELGRTGITITHTGKNGEYQADPELHSPKISED